VGWIDRKTIAAVQHRSGGCGRQRPVIPAKAGIHFDLDLGHTRVGGVEYAQNQNGFRLSPE
jgi:hypothetical protein